jgi:hypothetical protein
MSAGAGADLCQKIERRREKISFHFNELPLRTLHLCWIQCLFAGPLMLFPFSYRFLYDIVEILLSAKTT